VKYFLDQGVPRRAAELLRQGGDDVVHAGEVGLSSADDESLLAWCREHGRVAVTLDADFHALLAVGGHSRPSVIRVREEGLKGPEMARLIRTVLDQHKQALASGAMLTVRFRRVRVHALPVVRPREEG
jgi:predicted nuclease of predicted toxin-antitoxin system